MIGYALFFILFAVFLERAVFERVSNRVFRWRPAAEAPDVVEEAVLVGESNISSFESEDPGQREEARSR